MDAAILNNMAFAVISAFLITGGFAVWLTIINDRRCNKQKEQDHLWAIARNKVLDESGY
jgi:hypothetical protein|tara:strand:- start:620 stop:796 length:177 start_codon:yes stop_codon:yes gene_type:complete